MPFLLSLFSGCFQFSVSLFEDFYVSAFEFIQGGNVPDGAVQPRIVVIRYELLDHSAGNVKRKWHPGADAFSRMPVILPKDGESLWLDPENQNREELLSLLKPYSAEEMKMEEVKVRLG